MDVSAGREATGIEPLGRPAPAAAVTSQRVRPARVEVRIDQLMLEGVRPADASAVAAALERELGRLTSAGGLPTSWRDGAIIGRLDAGSLRAAPGMPPDTLGVQIAQALHRGLTGGAER